MQTLRWALAVCAGFVLAASLTWASGRLESGAGAPYAQFSTSTVTVVDAALLAAPGFLQCIMLTQADAAPTAGSLDIYDNASAASGTKVFSHTFTTAVFMPVQICPQRPMVNGIYADFTTTGDVNLIVSYRP